MVDLEMVTILLLGVPLAGALIILLGSKAKWLYLLTCILSSALTLLISIVAATGYGNSQVTSFSYRWLSLGSISLNLVFDYSNITVPLVLIVASISFLVTVYSIGFFLWDSHLPRYFSTLGFFTFSMVGLTLSGNLLQSFIFWELVGMSSYLLIGFYRNKPAAAAAGTKALIMNKVGDTGFIVALMALYAAGQGLDIGTLASISIPGPYKTLAGAGLLLAAFSKSAQFPFHSWLPDAMEGPTPVSALIHSATMVAAGVFLLVRLQFLLTPELLGVVAVIGTVTALLGGIHALREQELKRLLAWSTISQLGLMMMVIGGSGFESAYIHLLSHAIFKAGLFLAAGILISTAGSDLDNIAMSGKSRVVAIVVMILSLALMGLPLTIGFLSKEYLLAASTSPLYLFLFFLINTLSIFYGARIVAVVYPTVANRSQPGSVSTWMIVPVSILAVASFWFFYSPSPAAAPWIDLTFALQPPTPRLTVFSALWTLGWILVSLYAIRVNVIHKIGTWIPAFAKGNYLQVLFVQPALYLATVAQQTDSKIIDKSLHGWAYFNLSLALLVKWTDQNIVDGSVRLTAWLTRAIGAIFRQFVSGKIQAYIWWTLVAMVIFFILAR